MTQNIPLQTEKLRLSEAHTFTKSYSWKAVDVNVNPGVWLCHDDSHCAHFHHNGFSLQRRAVTLLEDWSFYFLLPSLSFLNSATPLMSF
jgi:hypothetical protein